MDKKALKLALIQGIIACEDEQILRTVKDILTNLAPTTESTDQDHLVAVLLQDKKAISRPASEKDIADLQQSIDEIFG